MITIKNQQELKLIEESGKILYEVKKMVFDAIKVGITTKELDSMACDYILSKNAKPAFKGYGGFPASLCVSINEEMIHGIPSNRVIKDGDIVKVDVGVIWKGYYSDSAFTKGVGNISSSDKKLIQITKEAFLKGFDSIEIGKTFGDVSFEIGDFISKNGYYVPLEYAGHGIGKELHEDPFIPNYGKPGTGQAIREGMVFCLEPMVLQGSSNVRVLSDGWTVEAINKLNTAHYEQTIIIRDGKAIIVTGDI